MASIFKFLPLLFFLTFFFGCQNEKKNQGSERTLRINFEDDPQTLDPRHVRDLSTATTIHMLYEGLMRMGIDGNPSPAIADTVSISPDRKIYTFHLRQSAWSNGNPVTAEDFEKTWKSLLKPDFPAPNAYQLFVIKGAREAKEGRGTSEDIGIWAINPSTLIVELEKPVPYFLHLAATHFLYPVHSSLLAYSLAEKDKENRSINHSHPITNGPFQLERWEPNNELTAVRNPHYWDVQSLHLDRIHFILLESSAALQIFEKGELDWTGSPIGSLPSDALASLKKEGKLFTAQAAGVYLLGINTEKDPFTHVKLRKAFGLALNRKELVEHVLQGGQRPAFSFIPPTFMEEQLLFEDHDTLLARRLFLEGRDEMGFSQENFPKVEIAYASSERAHKIAQVIQQEWKNIFDIEVALKSTEPKVYFDYLKKGNFQIAIRSWFADFCDPISFLEIFKFKDNGTNNTQWENKRFIELLNHSAVSQDQNSRENLLKEAQKLLIEEMPSIPLFYSTYLYVKNPKLKGVYFSELGYLDFKNAFFDDNP